MEFYYIFTDADGVIRGVQQSSGELSAEGYIRIEKMPEKEILGQKYLGLDEEGNAITEPVPQPAPEDNPKFWWIDVGPFYDRFGADALAIAASDIGACKAVQTLTGVRKYIDLKDPRIAQMIDMLIAVQQPAAASFAPGSGPMTAAKKDKILNTPTTEYERHIKGMFPGA